MPVSAVLAVSATLAALFSDFEPVERDNIVNLLLDVRAGVQCHYGDGQRAVVFTLSDPRRKAMFLMYPSGPSAPAYIRVRRNGTLDVDANGGITSYMAYARTTRYLMRKPQTPLTPKEVPAFFAKTDVQACPYKTWSDHAYEDGLREHGRPGQEP
jgi:hypothetical protein